MKIILDSNVCVAAFVSRGLCSAILELCIDRYDVIISEFILNEIKRVLTKKIKMNPKVVSDIILYLTDHFMLCQYEKLEATICRDADDDEILALARSNNCDFIITGDEDLLVLKEFVKTRIVNPREFWEYLRRHAR